jgi:two-component system, LuxR family, sensor kinase FixL
MAKHSSNRRITSLTVKITAGVMIVVGATLIPAAFLLAKHHRSTRLDSERRETRRQGELIRVALEHQMIRHDRALISEMVAGYSPEDTGKRILIFDRLGKLRYSNDDTPKTTNYSPIKSNACRPCHQHPPEARLRSTFLELEGGTVLRQIIPFENKPQCHKCHSASYAMNGVLIVDGSMDSISAEFFSDLRSFFLGLTLLALITAFGTQFLVRRLVVEPEQMMRIVGNLIDALINVNTEGKVLSVNRTARQMFNYERGTLKGQHISKILPGINLFEAHAELEKLLLNAGTGETSITNTASGQRADGTQFPIDLSVSEVQSGGKKIYTVVIRDISYQIRAREAEDHLAALQSQFSHLERLAVAGEMAAMVAHDLRTPLNALSIQLQRAQRILRRGSDKIESVEDLLAHSRNEIKRINSQVERYLTSVRRPTKTLEKKVALNSVIKESVEFIGRAADKSDVSVSSRLGEGVGESRINAGELRQVLLNLLLNAIQAMPDGGEVFIESRGDAEHIQIYVADTGPGISREAAKKLFNPFFTTKEEGTGLGLAICSRIVSKFGGTVDMDESWKKGASFRIKLPRLS